MKSNIMFLTILFSILISCNTDSDPVDDILSLKDVEGIVLSLGQCNTENNGIVYQVRITNNDKIIVPNLADEFKEANLRIKFNMTKSNEGITICQTTITPQSYLLTNVNLISANNEN